MKYNYSKLILLFSFILCGFQLNAQVTTYDYSGTIETYVVPPGVTSININAKGAQGGYSGGLGANMSGNFSVTPGQVIEILVGSVGAVNISSGNEGGAGGGGSFVVDQATGEPLIVAGGGGGGCLVGGYGSYTGPYDASITNAQLTEDGASTRGGGGGTGGNGAQAGFTDCCLPGSVGGAGGGGFFTAGEDGSSGAEGGRAYVDGGAGGLCGTTSPDSYPVSGSGGFGGGGGSSMDNAFRAGGGGGYSGGQGAVYISSSLGYLYGGGGGSFNSGSDQVNTVDQTGDGQIIITVLCEALTVTVSDDAVCLGESFTLDASGAGTISWDGGVENGVPFTAETAGVFTYTASSDDADDCGYTVEIEVFALPVVVASADATSICAGESVTLSGSGADSYVWDLGVTDGVAFTPGAGTATYTVTGTDAVTGCENTASIDVTVNDVVVTSTTTDELFGGDGSIDITVTGGTPAYSFDWDNDGTGDFDDTEDLTGLDGGVYIVVVEDEAGCSTIYTVVVDSQLGTSELTQNSVSVYPNPTTDQVTITLNGNFNYQLIAVNGEVLLNGTALNQSIVDMNSFAAGTYLIRLTQNENSQLFKVIKN